jgi:outer membrane protein OmpA-like peptidoglycan-associated protein
LDITGKINPLAPRNYIDLRAVARGFDLPKLSPYSGRWAGYAIEKGKLTANVRYKVEGDKLDAENKLVINQLTFGDKIDSADATSLPVRLAVSLLKDRNGNIDLDLPIGGTISDPQFSVGGLLWRAIGNLILKVVSSPFTLLASLAGGGSEAGELSHIEFAAGASSLDDEDRKRLDGLARALASRPELSIDIGGVGDPAADRDAMQRERLERTLKRAKLAQMRRADPRAELPSIADLRLDDTERATLLEAAWREAKLDAGSGGTVPASDELERVLLEQAPIATEEVKQVAQARAQSARDYLRDTRGISNERLYLLAPRIAETGDPLPPRRADFTVK